MRVDTRAKLSDAVIEFPPCGSPECRYGRGSDCVLLNPHKGSTLSYHAYGVCHILDVQACLGAVRYLCGQGRWQETYSTDKDDGLSKLEQFDEQIHETYPSDGSAPKGWHLAKALKENAPKQGPPHRPFPQLSPLEGDLRTCRGIRPARPHQDLAMPILQVGVTEIPYHIRHSRPRSGRRIVVAPWAGRGLDR